MSEMPVDAAASDPADGRRTRLFDWRRPSKFTREHIRSLDVAHEVFARRLASGLGSALRALVQLEPVSIDQVSYDDYIRSLPNPNVLAVIGMPPLPGAALLEVNVQLALQLVDRLLGGRGLPVDLRRPTDLELHLIRDLIGHGVAAIGETMEPVLDTAPELVSIELNPQLVQVTAPSDMALLLCYRLTVSQAEPSEGLLTLCYPSITLAPALDHLARHFSREQEELEVAQDDDRRLAEQFDDVSLSLSVRLAESGVMASDLAALAIGDVLRLDHRADQPVVGAVGSTAVVEGHVGKRGRRLAFQVQRWLGRDDAPHAVVAARRSVT